MFKSVIDSTCSLHLKNSLRGPAHDQSRSAHRAHHRQLRGHIHIEAVDNQGARMTMHNVVPGNEPYQVVALDLERSS